jgi:hypothetical protein
MFFAFDIRAAEMGTVLVKSDRSRIALAERTMGGRKRDISLEGAASVGFYDMISQNRTFLMMSTGSPPCYRLMFNMFV